jgi:PTH1 family peptidyl-tRNA hydrolase
VLTHDAICLSLRDGVEKAMSLYNQKFVDVEDTVVVDQEHS